MLGRVVLFASAPIGGAAVPTTFVASSSATITNAAVHMLHKLSLARPHPILLTVAPRKSFSTLVVVQKNVSSAPLLERYRINGSKLYSRYILGLLALQLATEESIARLEARQRPVEWDRGADILQELEDQELATYKAGLGKTAVVRVFNAGCRIGSLLLLAAPLAILAPLSYLSPKLEDMAWSYATWSVETAGPTFTKLAQWASTRADLFPAEFVGRFAKLQDATEGHSWAHTERILCQSLGDDYADLIHLDPKPIGSGCIAQVYKGILQQPTALFPQGTELAIKVQHPNIRAKVLVDFYILHKMASFLERLPWLNLGYLSLQDSVGQFRSIMIPQLDMTCEARNLTRFLRDFSNDDSITFPQPIHELTSEQVLVEKFMHGEPILNYLRPDHSTEDRHAIAEKGLEMAMKMIFLNDFVHGDLHPGNILVQKNKTNNVRLVVLDCGLVVEMGQREHKNLVAILGAMVKKDGLLAGQLMVDTAKRCQASDEDVRLFCEGIQRICIDDEVSNFLENVGDYLADICYLACKHKVKLEASFINAALACEIMEGIAVSLYPDMKVQGIALPMVFKAELMHGLKQLKRPTFSF